MAGEVPLTLKGETIGTAVIHEDGTADLFIDDSTQGGARIKREIEINSAYYSLKSDGELVPKEARPLDGE